MKCTICNKELGENLTDYEILQHFIFNHKDVVILTAKNLKEQSKNDKRNKVYKSV